MPRRCSYLTSRGKQCQQAGIGNPPLCKRHREEIEPEPGLVDEVASVVFERAEVRGVVNRVSSILDRVAQAIDNAATWQPKDIAKAAQEAAERRERQHQERQAQEPPRARRQEQAPPKRPAPQTSKDDPYTVLGFQRGARITPDMIKNRKRELSQLFHPDRGGSTEAMAKVNAAADALLDELRTARR